MSNNEILPFPPSPDMIQKLDEGMGILVLVSGTLMDGQAHYAYASVAPSKYVAFKEAEAVGNYDLSQFGKILAHGDGKEPPQEVKQQMEEEYGANHYLEEELGKLMAQTRGEGER